MNHNKCGQYLTYMTGVSVRKCRVKEACNTLEKNLQNLIFSCMTTVDNKSKTKSVIDNMILDDLNVHKIKFTWLVIFQFYARKFSFLYLPHSRSSWTAYTYFLLKDSISFWFWSTLSPIHSVSCHSNYQIIL